MAKKIRFPLKMEQGIEVRTLEELREHFSFSRIFMYLSNGKLVTWLKDQYEDDLADLISQLDRTDKNLPRKICEIFNVNYDESYDKSFRKIEGHSKKLKALKEYTSEQQYMNVVDNIAFNQKELQELIDQNIKEIYLCGESFSIPLSKGGVHYNGINNPTVRVDSKKVIDWKKKDISFSNITFDDKYQMLLTCLTELAEKKAKENEGTYTNKSILNPLLTPEQRKEAEESFKSIYKQIKDLNYDINKDIQNAKSIIIASNIIGIADDYIKNL